MCLKHVTLAEIILTAVLYVLVPKVDYIPVSCTRGEQNCGEYIQFGFSTL